MLFIKENLSTIPNKKFTKEELIQAVRQDIIGELEAINQYDYHQMSTDNIVAKKILSTIRDEEKVHVGELFTLLRYLDPTEADFFLEGESEAKKIIESLKQ